MPAKFREGAQFAKVGLQFVHQESKLEQVLLRAN
jgi:hypothetical protein